jgi:chemotaxis family two-component system response regulator PixG
MQSHSSDRLVTPSDFLRLAAALYRKQGTGVLTVARGVDRWRFYFCQGRLMWAVGGSHRVRRFRRAWGFHCPEVPLEAVVECYRDRVGPEDRALWECFYLRRALEADQLAATAARAMVRQVFREVVFDALRSPVNFQWASGRLSGASVHLSLTGQDLQAALQSVQVLQQGWGAMGLAAIAADQGIQVLAEGAEASAGTSQSVLNLQNLFDGQHTFWDAALLFGASIKAVLRLLHHFRQQNRLVFQPLPDLPTEALLPPAPSSWYGTVLCIDDHRPTCRLVEKITQALGYRCISCHDPLQAVPTAIAAKPDLIFLDVIMPIVNGYEVCTQLRRVSTLTETPVVILTGRDGIGDRLRSKFVKASGFVSKPVTPDKVREAITRYALDPQGRKVLEGRLDGVTAGSAAHPDPGFAPSQWLGVGGTA